MTRSAGLPADARAGVITVSDRSHGGERHDSSGPLLSELLAAQGFTVDEVVVVPDEIAHVEAALRTAVAAGVDLVATTGGTGFSPRDVTPEATRRVIDREAPGIAESLRQHRRDEVPTTILSRAVAGIAASTLIVNLPGSTGGVRDGVAVLAPVVGHAVAQLRGGGDH
jgi:molybdenum cofactor synthesis domain-containing protein